MKDAEAMATRARALGDEKRRTVHATQRKDIVKVAEEIAHRAADLRHGNVRQGKAGQMINRLIG